MMEPRTLFCVVWACLLALIWGPLAGDYRLPAAPIGSPPSGEGSVAAAPPPLVAKAIAAFQQQDFQGALRWLEQAHQQHPELAPAEILLANMYFSEEQPSKGREVLERAVVQYPQDPEPHLIFGDLAWRERRLSDAQVQYERGGHLTSSFDGPPERKQQLKIRALTGLANVAEARGQFEDARKWIRALLTVEPDHANAHFRLGNVLFALDQPEEALAEFRTAAGLLDSAPSPPLTLAQLYQQSGERGQAKRWIEQAIDEAPDDLRPQLAMARWQLESGDDPAAAMPYVDRAAQLDPESTGARLLRGLIAWCQGDLDGAEELFEAVALKQPADATANNYLAAVLAEQGNADRERAWELVQLTAATNPQAAELAATIGWVAFQRGHLDLAEQQLRRAAAAPGAGRDASYYLARTLFRRGQIAQAQRVLARALAADGLFIHLRQAQQWQREIGAPDNAD